MSALSKSGTPSLSTVTPCNGHKTPAGLLAGEAIAAGDACYIKSDGKAWKAIGTSAAAATVAGFAAAAASSGEAVTLYRDVMFRYGASMTPGTAYYVSGSTAGGLDTVASTYGIVPVARAYDATRLWVLPTGSETLPSALTSNGASLAEGKLSTTTLVDANVTTKTTLYTVPASKVAYITKVVIRDASTSLTTATFGFGFNANADDVVANATHTGLTGGTLYEIIPAKVAAKEGAAADIFGVQCDTPQGGAATVTIDVFGYLVDA